ncbi:hypothetical protein G7007_20165 [Pseudomonas entomophila]|uniref:hypothetical protein n=1 Tax=Pseudomonas entomophila TaxID=312306 RepID=UPI0015E46488|nr:hypothetical protein [Pseudomonas entomophila]MBA1195140.1 hypothetical protein [Pseudomonas entomophila]
MTSIASRRASAEGASNATSSAKFCRAACSRPLALVAVEVACALPVPGALYVQQLVVVQRAGQAMVTGQSLAQQRLGEGVDLLKPFETAGQCLLGEAQRGLAGQDCLAQVGCGIGEPSRLLAWQALRRGVTGEHGMPLLDTGVSAPGGQALAKEVMVRIGGIEPWHGESPELRET